MDRADVPSVLALVPEVVRRRHGLSGRGIHRQAFLAQLTTGGKKARTNLGVGALEQGKGKGEIINWTGTHAHGRGGGTRCKESLLRGFINLMMMMRYALWTDGRSGVSSIR